MTPAPRSRARAREAQIDVIKDVALRLIREKSVAGLSLREVARKMGLVSSAIYRYFATRDDLLTALILDAYNDLGASVERAEAKVARNDVAQRWHVAARALRRWAKRHPHEYALIYGTPVPGYEAPLETIDAAARVPRVLGAIVSARPRTTSKEPAARRGRRGAEAYLEIENLAAVMPGVAPDDYLIALMAWTQLFGFLNFELFGQYVGSVTNANLMFEGVIDELARSLSL